MNLVKIISTQRADADLEAIGSHIGVASSAVAANWFNRLRDEIASLAIFPGRGTRMASGRRSILFGRRPDTYRIIYSVSNDQSTVTILTIRLFRRRPIR